LFLTDIEERVRREKHIIDTFIDRSLADDIGIQISSDPFRIIFEYAQECVQNGLFKDEEIISLVLKHRLYIESRLRERVKNVW
jgi:hypothetical protein